MPVKTTKIAAAAAVLDDTSIFPFHNSQPGTAADVEP
jgi:hypothetical protein